MSNFLALLLDSVHKKVYIYLYIYLYIFFFAQEDFDYLRAQKIIRLWMSSKVCSVQFLCKANFY